MKTCHKLAVSFFSFGMLIGTAYAQEEKQAAPSQQPAEENVQHVRYGRRMHRNVSYDNYCDDSPCSDYRRSSRMSHDDRKMLRQQVNEAGKTLYSKPHH